MDWTLRNDNSNNYIYENDRDKKGVDNANSDIDNDHGSVIMTTMPIANVGKGKSLLKC